MAIEDAAELAAWADRYVRDAPAKAAKAARDRASSSVESTRAMSVALFAALDKTERCHVCGRELRDPVSVQRKIGPECWEKQPAFSSEYVQRAEGEVFVQTGIARLVSATPVKGVRDMLEVTLTVAGRKTPVVAHADLRGAVFRHLRGGRHVGFVVNHHRVDLAYHYEIRRVAGADKATPLAKLPRSQKRRVLVDLKPVDAVDAPDVRRAG